MTSGWATLLTRFEAVVFQISQIGSDPSSKEFLQKLKDQNLENVYITSRKLDSPTRWHSIANINP